MGRFPSRGRTPRYRLNESAPNSPPGRQETHCSGRYKAMALEEEQSSVVQEMRSAIDCLRNCADLAGVDAATLDELAAGASHFSLPAGRNLFELGSLSDGVYLLISGRLVVRTSESREWDAEIAGGELVGEAAWLLRDTRSADLVAVRDSELLLIPTAVMDAATGGSTTFAMALARLCARRLRRSNRRARALKRARVFVIVPNNDEIDVADLATQLVAELARTGSTELVWDVRASSHTSAWFNRIEESKDFVVYVAGPEESGWTRQCCRQADVILLAARAEGACSPWPNCISDSAIKRNARIELALVHDGIFTAGAAARWLACSPTASHHPIPGSSDLRRIRRPLARRRLGLLPPGRRAPRVAPLVRI